MDLQHPLIESLALPLAVAFALAGVLRVTGSGTRDVPFASLGVGIGFVLAIYLVSDGLAWPPRTALQKLPYIAAGALAVGVLLEGIAIARLWSFVAAAAMFVGALLWLAWPQFAQATAGDLGMLLLFFLAGVIVLWRLSPAERKSDPTEAVMLVLAALGLSGAAFNAGSLVLFQLGLALAAAVGGFVLWNWPRPRLRFGPSGRLAGAIGLLGIIALLLMLSDIRPWALLSLLPVFFADRAARLLPVPRRADRQAVEPVYVVLVSLPFVAATVLLSAPAPPADDLYYY